MARGPMKHVRVPRRRKDAAELAVCGTWGEEKREQAAQEMRREMHADDARCKRLWRRETGHRHNMIAEVKKASGTNHKALVVRELCVPVAVDTGQKGGQGFLASRLLCERVSRYWNQVKFSSESGMRGFCEPAEVSSAVGSPLPTLDVFTLLELLESIGGWSLVESFTKKALDHSDIGHWSHKSRSNGFTASRPYTSPAREAAPDASTTGGNNERESVEFREAKGNTHHYSPSVEKTRAVVEGIRELDRSLTMNGASMNNHLRSGDGRLRTSVMDDREPLLYSTQTLYVTIKDAPRRHNDRTHHQKLGCVGYKTWLGTTRRCPQHLALAPFATRHSPLEMTYPQADSFVSYALDNSLDTSGMMLPFGGSMRLDSCLPSQVEQSVDSSANPRTPWTSENSYLDIMRSSEYMFTHWYSDLDPAVHYDGYDGIVFTSEHASEYAISAAKCLLTTPIDPILIAHPRTYEIASALDYPGHAPSSPKTLSTVSTCSDSTLSVYTPSPSPYSTTSSLGSDNGSCDHEVTCSPFPRNPSSASSSLKDRSVPYCPSSSSSILVSLSSTSQTRRPKARRSPIRVRRRNVQVGTIVPEPRATRVPKLVQCTVKGCGKVLTKGTMRRHKETHKEQDKWRCCGIPIEMAFGLANADTSSVRRMVGGCWEVFSRKDALERHLKNPNNPCIGDVERAELLGRNGISMYKSRFGRQCEASTLSIPFLVVGCGQRLRAKTCSRSSGETASHTCHELLILDHHTAEHILQALPNIHLPQIVTTYQHTVTMTTKLAQSASVASITLNLPGSPREAATEHIAVLNLDEQLALQGLMMMAERLPSSGANTRTLRLAAPQAASVVDASTTAIKVPSRPALRKVVARQEGTRRSKRLLEKESIAPALSNERQGKDGSKPRSKAETEQCVLRASNGSGDVEEKPTPSGEKSSSTKRTKRKRNENNGYGAQRTAAKKKRTVSRGHARPLLAVAIPHVIPHFNGRLARLLPTSVTHRLQCTSGGPLRKELSQARMCATIQHRGRASIRRERTPSVQSDHQDGDYKNRITHLATICGRRHLLSSSKWFFLALASHKDQYALGQASNDYGTEHGTDARTAARGGEHTALLHNVGAPSGYKTWLGTTRRCPQHLALVLFATRHSPLEMPYDPPSSFNPTYPLDDPLDVWGLSSTFERSLCLDPYVNTQAVASVSALRSAELLDSYFYAESPLGTCKESDSVWYPNLNSTAPYNDYNGMLLMPGYEAGSITTIECTPYSPEIDPILLAHPSTYEIASALNDPTYSRDIAASISAPSSSPVFAPFPCTPSSSPDSITFSPGSTNSASESGSSRCLSLPIRSAVQSRKHRSHPYRRSASTSSRSVSARDSSSPSPRTGSSNTRRSPRHTRRRNVQVDGKVPDPEDMDEPGMVKCKSCDLVLLKTSMKRHIETHGLPGKWSCCGVPVELASEYGIPASAKPYEHKGRWMVGGCETSCTRKDALVRHLKSESKECVGDVDVADALGWLEDASQ
ncbi:hypothetical protein IEO21_09455 [Rhodonia placenta]|uniref:C2H2-type domain-containing protein n=1 Tax=Rhodonia placenta TaxID=104341 RepID=A0A8H7NUE5_9APHY|nr:hypothetical protein IEO21_09455 [Postia placenta]